MIGDLTLVTSPEGINSFSTGVSKLSYLMNIQLFRGRGCSSGTGGVDYRLKKRALKTFEGCIFKLVEEVWYS